MQSEPRHKKKKSEANTILNGGAPKQGPAVYNKAFVHQHLQYIISKAACILCLYASTKGTKNPREKLEDMNIKQGPTCSYIKGVGIVNYE